MKVLGIDDFFYVSDRSYDYLAEKALPHYHESHKLLVSSLCFDSDMELEIIDLGVGSGVTSAYILRNFPRAKIIGVDLFNEMLEDARVRLKPFEDRVQLVQSDNTKFLKSYQGKVNAVVSSFCIHHQDEQGKKELFEQIYEKLLPGGSFLMLDLTTFEDSCLREQARQATIEHMKLKVNDEVYREKWIYHWNNVNVPHAADKLIVWLRENLFQAEIVFRNYEIALIMARK